MGFNADQGQNICAMFLLFLVFDVLFCFVFFMFDIFYVLFCFVFCRTIINTIEDCLLNYVTIAIHGAERGLNNNYMIIIFIAFHRTAIIMS